MFALDYSIPLLCFWNATIFLKILYNTHNLESCHDDKNMSLRNTTMTTADPPGRSSTSKPPNTPYVQPVLPNEATWRVQPAPRKPMPRRCPPRSSRRPSMGQICRLQHPSRPARPCYHPPEGPQHAHSRRKLRRLLPRIQNIIILNKYASHNVTRQRSSFLGLHCWTDVVNVDRHEWNPNQTF